MVRKLSAGLPNDMETQEGSRLYLEWHGQTVCLTPADTLTLGSSPQAEFKVRGDFVSRMHALIRSRRQYFILEDSSTNGTYLQSEDQRVKLVHRQSERLWGTGWLSFGEPLNEDNAIRYRYG